jgi:hypothetical protein
MSHRAPRLVAVGAKPGTRAFREAVSGRVPQLCLAGLFGRGEITVPGLHVAGARAVRPALQLQNALAHVCTRR